MEKSFETKEIRVAGCGELAGTGLMDTSECGGIHHSAETFDSSGSLGKRRLAEEKNEGGIR